MIKKNSLGKGLGAMFPDLLEKIGDKPVLVTCGIEELVPNRYQARKDFDPEEHKSLVASIRKSGIIQPIVARRSDGGYEIIAGERQMAGRPGSRPQGCTRHHPGCRRPGRGGFLSHRKPPEGKSQPHGGGRGLPQADE